jgi:hypothetical protein
LRKSQRRRRHVSRVRGHSRSAKGKASELTKEDVAILAAYKKNLDSATKFIPDWVKVSVAIALGLGTTIGWKRIVVTVGEKIGKTHLTYGQGGAAELVAMEPSPPPTISACPFRRRTSSPLASRERWPPTALACRCRRSAASPSPGC